MSYPLSVTAELYYSGAWQDITADVRQTVDPVITWGRANESSAVNPTTLSLVLNNGTSKVNTSVSGRYSPRNPLSDLYGLIGRNTPLRVLLGTSSPRLTLPGDEEAYAITPDAAALDITGDIDMRMEFQPVTWRPTGFMGLARKYRFTDFERSWAWWITPDGFLRFRWSTNGALATEVTATSTAAVPDDDARRAVRVMLNVDNGATQNEVTFWTAPDITGPWTALGAVVVNAGVTSIHSSAQPLEVGRTRSDGSGGISADPVEGDIFGFELRNGIGGTVVAELDLAAQNAGDTTWTDSPGRVWTVHGDAVTDPAVRFAGEVASWPARWDLSGSDVWVPIEAAGTRRRLDQGASALRSSLYRGLTSTNVTTPVGYWPMEDGKDATSMASAIPGHKPLEIVGDVELAAFSDAPASDAIPTITTGHFAGRVSSYATGNVARMMVFASFPETLSAPATIFQVITNGTARKWRCTLQTNGNVRLQVWDADDVSLSNVVIGFTVLGQRGLFWLLMTQDGADVDRHVGFQREGDTGSGGSSGTITNQTKGQVLNFHLGGFDSENCEGMAVGHAVVLDSAEFWDIAPFARAWSGETAIERIRRLCEEEEVPLRVDGVTDDSQLVGPQRIATFLELIDASAAVDQGILTDDRDALRLLYRSGETLYNQTPALTIDYSSGQVAGSLEPVEDDQITRNDVTASRPDGSSARVEQLTGPLSVLAPPNGVGRYDESVEVHVYRDSALPDQAAWRLHLGTVDEARYPAIRVNLGRDPSLSTAATGVMPGDRVQITNPPAWLPPDTIDQIAQGGREILNAFRHEITYNCSPASPWTVAEVGDSVLGKADTLDSTTTASFTSGTDTSMTVATNAGPIWTTAAGQFPFDIKVAGVVLTVTAISGASSPQTFTITQTPVNGVAKTIPSGSAVNLANPAVIAL